LGAAAVVVALQFKIPVTTVLVPMAEVAVATVKALQAAMVRLIAVVVAAEAMTEVIQLAVLAALSCVTPIQKRQRQQQPAAQQLLFPVAIGPTISQVQGASLSDGTFCTG
jgi:hypothetical protein